MASIAIGTKSAIRIIAVNEAEAKPAGWERQDCQSGNFSGNHQRYGWTGGSVMGIFTRFRDIVSSNINNMLDRAEDPEKMIKLMIREIEDTLVELKASCAGVMAETKKLQRQLEQVRTREQQWSQRAQLAVDKGRDDLAREALVEKRRFSQSIEALDRELMQREEMVAQYQEDIRQLEEKLGKAREKQRLLVQRHIRASHKRQAQEEIRRMDHFETVAKFEEFENRIERMEAEADLVNYGRHGNLEAEFSMLDADEEIEKQLAALKSEKRPQPTADHGA
jgi:phage shock protein A